MRPFTRLVWKEARELLRPRYILPILLLPVLFIAMGQGLGGVEDQLSQRPQVGLVDYDDGDVVSETLHARTDVVYNATDGTSETALNRTTEAGGSAVVVLPETSQFIFVPVVIMFAIIISGQMVMNSMASEKENKTLETLLSMPVRRRQIVAAKLLGGSTVGLIATALYTGGLAFTQLSVDSSLGGTAVTLGGFDYVLIAVSLFLSLVGMLALALGVFADSQQGAQMLLFPLSGLALIPMFATMFADIDTMGTVMKTALLAIPSTHPIIAPKRLQFDDVGLVLAGIAYEVLFAVAAVWLVIKLFDSDRPIAGDAGWLDRVVEFVQQ